jgi:hypothetical protein
MALLILFPAMHARASECRGTFGRLMAAPDKAYDPFAPEDSRQHYVLSVRNQGEIPCAFAVDMSSEHVPLSFEGKLRYDLADGGGAALPFPGATLVTPLLRPGEEHKLTFLAMIGRGQATPPGRYHDRIGAILRAAHGHAARYTLDRAALYLTCRVASITEVNIAGAGLRTAIDFGELVSGDRRSVLLEVRANQHYSLQIQSEHGGVLALSPSIPGETWSIDYALLIDDRPVHLRPHTAVYFPVPKIIEEEQHKFTVSIGDVSGKRAGLYRDVITITITASP